MAATLEATPSVQGQSMPRGKKKEPAEEVGGQVSAKLGVALWDRYLAVARALGLDHANLNRMIIAENLYIYERRARAAEQAANSTED